MSHPPSPPSPPTVSAPQPPPLRRQEATFRSSGAGGASHQGQGEDASYQQWFRERHRASHRHTGGWDGSTPFGSANEADHHAPRSARWSFLLQDMPKRIRRTLNSIHYGYAARVTLALGVTFGVSYAFYRGVLVRSQESKPLAQRWWLLSPPVAITLIDRQQIEGTNMYYYRFALPHSYDYAGFDPISSVQIRSGKVRGLSSVQRWYTPISHPEERGIIEFAIKDCDPGRMSARLRGLGVGDQVYLGRWMREFRYDAKKHKEIGMVCSTGGASVALQLLNYLDKQPMNSTCVSLLYCHASPLDIPFRREFQDFAARDNRFSVKFNVLGLGMDAYKNPSGVLPDGLVPGKTLFSGNIQPETIRRSMPPPIRTEMTQDGAVSTYRPPVLICGPQSMLTFLCGKVSTIGHTTYWQGPFYKYYTGFLRDLGYERKQVYKFGVSKHFMAIQ